MGRTKKQAVEARAELAKQAAAEVDPPSENVTSDEETSEKNTDEKQTSDSESEHSSDSSTKLSASNMHNSDKDGDETEQEREKEAEIFDSEGAQEKKSVKFAKLSLAKSFKTALTSKVQLSDKDADLLIDEILRDSQDKKPEPSAKD